MAQTMGSKEAAAYLIDPMTAPEPSAETGPGSHFSSTFAPAPTTPATANTTGNSARTSLSSNNPFRESSIRNSPPEKKSSATVTERPASRGSPRQRFPDYRGEAFGGYSDAPKRRSGSAQPAPPSYDDVVTGSPSSSSSNPGHRRRTSSLRARYPGDHSAEPLNVIRRDSRKADRSPHLKKRHQPGPDTIDRLDPAIGGVPYHHEGPYDATLLARNTSYTSSPVAALQISNAEALRATPRENIQDAIERHQPLDGTAAVPPGVPDRLGRVYDYEEGADLMRETQNDGPGYKRWADKDYSPDDLKGESEPMFSLNRKLKNHRISGDGIELTDSASKRNSRDPVEAAGGESRYVDLEIANARDSEPAPRRSSSIREGLKKRIGSLRHRKNDD